MRLVQTNIYCIECWWCELMVYCIRYSLIQSNIFLYWMQMGSNHGILHYVLKAICAIHLWLCLVIITDYEIITTAVLKHCGLVMLNGIIEIDQHWPKYGLLLDGTITWTNVDLSSKVFFGIIWDKSQVLINIIYNRCWEITNTYLSGQWIDVSQFAMQSGYYMIM